MDSLRQYRDIRGEVKRLMNLVPLEIDMSDVEENIMQQFIKAKQEEVEQNLRYLERILPSSRIAIQELERRQREQYEQAELCGADTDLLKELHALERSALEAEIEAKKANE